MFITAIITALLQRYYASLMGKVYTLLQKRLSPRSHSPLGQAGRKRGAFLRHAESRFISGAPEVLWDRGGANSCSPPPPPPPRFKAKFGENATQTIISRGGTAPLANLRAGKLLPLPPTSGAPVILLAAQACHKISSDSRRHGLTVTCRY